MKSSVILNFKLPKFEDRLMEYFKSVMLECIDSSNPLKFIDKRLNLFYKNHREIYDFNESEDDSIFSLNGVIEDVRYCELYGFVLLFWEEPKKHIKGYMYTSNLNHVIALDCYIEQKRLVYSNIEIENIEEDIELLCHKVI